MSEKQKHRCPECKKQFNTKRKLTNHKRTHQQRYQRHRSPAKIETLHTIKNQRQVTYKDLMDNLDLDKQQALNRLSKYRQQGLIKPKHRDTNTCSICGETFDSKKLLKIHNQQQQHPGVYVLTDKGVRQLRYLQNQQNGRQ